RSPDREPRAGAPGPPRRRRALHQRRYGGGARGGAPRPRGRARAPAAARAARPTSPLARGAPRAAGAPRDRPRARAGDAPRPRAPPHAIGTIQRRDLGDTAAAVATYRRALAEDPSDRAALAALLELHEASGDWEALYTEQLSALERAEGEERIDALRRL